MVRHEVEVADGNYTNEVLTVSGNNVEILGMSMDRVWIQGSVTLGENATVTFDRILLIAAQTAGSIVTLTGVNAFLRFRYVYIIGSSSSVMTDHKTVVTAAVSATPPTVNYDNGPCAFSDSGSKHHRWIRWHWLIWQPHSHSY